MKNKNILQACNLIIFGTNGDLAKKKLLPSLYQLEKKNMLHNDTKIIGVGRVRFSKEDYIKMVYQSLKISNKKNIKEVIWKKFNNRLSFYNIDINFPSQFLKLKNIIEEKEKIIINYLATPPDTFKIICDGLNYSNLNNKNSRIIIEKPLGKSFITCKKINNHIKKYFTEKQIFRIDHYLGKETILNLLSLRFANTLFINNWDNKTIDHIQITIAESIGIEGRWKYFDKIGQMRDMVQNHLLQILTIIAMDPPESLDEDQLREKKISVLKSLRPINYKNVLKKTVKGQYTSNIIQNKNIKGYLEENEANKKSNTETFVCIKANIDNWRWYGVPFYLRTGKRLPIKYSEIVIYFKKPKINLFKKSLIKLPQNKITIRLQSNEGIDIQILNKTPGLNNKDKLQAIKLNCTYSKIFNYSYLSDSYENLLLESMIGIQKLFVKKEEIEEAWKWIDLIIEAWKIKKQKIYLYPAGSWGPNKALLMINKDKRNWNNFNNYQKNNL
ncbi:glucose-6-phosphate dehydrogenase [Candidatus Purcelliella pentastirinorum]|uniref:glucose-6-phosphate dehydrogenase n=1 Tax=Candidatus Purcelliella pentastirinorum TaxID=472834 RepID=UPI002368E3C2|nr:glucose-6-phosphate dehydrogenase [Candidatus Purcelliella pentastirinorum]WDI78967.1 glucose-6-phosphate dehydrogenase [Candidatus Purcelliella pentastirinorum]WDR80103.1 glucose-6-phosphate dehydrogenase [Candidatus Purcelliella pentastirinorum]